MITIRFGAADLASVRFAISPLIELWQSVRALQEPAARALHLPWLAHCRRQFDDLDLSVLCALHPVRGYSPDFLHPPPKAPTVEFEDELGEMLSTPPDQVRFQVAQAEMYSGKALPPALQRFVEEPDVALGELAGLVRVFWERAIAPYWPRIRAVLEGDVLYRARQSAYSGARMVFADIHEGARYEEQRLHLDIPWDVSIRLGGRGLLFVPSVFAWPALPVMDEEPLQPTVIYPARGSALLWELPEPAPRALAALIGSRRATVLGSLDAPRSTTDLARRLSLPPGSVSQHLLVLRQAGLITRHRTGRVVLYSRSPAGEMLANGSARISPNGG